MPPKMKFAEGERVLCYHGPLLYEAKCVKSDVKEKTVRYFIHYNGWNKKLKKKKKGNTLSGNKLSDEELFERNSSELNCFEFSACFLPFVKWSHYERGFKKEPALSWDEWVPETRVLKYNDASLQRQKELQKAHAGFKKTKTKKDKEKGVLLGTEKTKHKSSLVTGPGGGSSGNTTGDGGSTSSVSSTPASSTVGGSTTSTTTEPKRKRAKIDPTVESEETFQAKIEVRVKVPDDLKLWLVDDWDLVTKQKKLLRLPSKKNIESILDDYIKFKTTKSNNNKDAVKLVIQGLREYFNMTIGTQLLYKFERPQYTELLEENPDSPLSSIYGAAHLLRLFVKIGGMLAYTSLDEKSIQLLLTHFHDFLRYLQKNALSLLSVNDYMSVTPEYLRKVG
ncbi:MORF4L1 [Acanthosepion pharaonis]|uniref:MORF4L1 n=1 Tax=Acanthosepion pharaonis TaxID=158019 RepID=A0A812CI55_ACAPH|nr:MORF4L1 [Sepia pharaonis]